MKEKEFKNYRRQKCLEEILYGDTENHAYYSYPTCPYYDIEANRCELNTCIKNTVRRVNTMTSKKGYFIDIEKGVVTTAEEHDEEIRAGEKTKTIDEFLERVLYDNCEGKCPPNVMYCYKCVAMRVAEQMKEK